jgi:hypothetical protein
MSSTPKWASDSPEAELERAHLQAVLRQLRRVYRAVGSLNSGRRPVDFTVALLALRLVAEREGWDCSWVEGSTQAGAGRDAQIVARWALLADRCLEDPRLNRAYGAVFRFSESNDHNSEIAFDFQAVLRSIPVGRGHFTQMLSLVEQLPDLHGAGFDIFGEVYQALGDEATKKSFGEYFTGRHIIDGVVPILFERAGISGKSSLKSKRIADIACGTGGFLSGVLHHVHRELGFNDGELRAFVQESIYGYDLSHSNASRARVNIYLAAGAFGSIRGGADSLDAAAPGGPGARTFDYVLTNPPYGSSALHQRLHERFLARAIDLLKPGTGRGLIILPAGTLENPSSARARLDLLRRAQITDVIALPKHAFSPYAVQRTAVVLFRRREAPLSADCWDDLLAQVGDERLSMFIVDHDGFANSEKRFPTRRRDIDGSWLHNDLAGWTDQEGHRRASAVMRALIHEAAPPVEDQYACMTLRQMHDALAARGSARDAGINLLPDTYLRRSRREVPAGEFAKAVRSVEQKLLSSEGEPVESAIRALLNTGVTFTSPATSQLGDLFHFHVGTRALTEAVMYDAHDPVGIPVYGGGANAAAQRISPNAVSGEGRPVRVFEGPALVLALDGTSGLIQVVRSGSFACNHHAGVLLPRDLGTDLDIVAQQAEASLRELASNRSGSSTLAQRTIMSLRVELPTIDAEADLVREARRKLARLRGVIGR